MGERVLSQIQYGPESTRGTAVAATRKLGATIKAIPIDRKWEAVKYADGSRANATHKRNDVYLVEDTLTIEHGYFQAFPMLFQCSLDGTITPTEQTGSQGDYLWTSLPSLTAANDPDTITLELGDNIQAYEIEYCMFRRIKISGKIAQDGGPSPVSIEAEYFGRQVTPTTFTSSLSLPTGLEMLNAKFARLYLDTAWAGLGGTEQTSLLREFEIELLAANHPKSTGSGNRYFDTHGEGEVATMATFVLEGASGADSIYDLYQAGTERAMRFQLSGGQIASGVNHRLRVDAFGYFEAVRPMDQESNGNNLHVAIFRSKKDTSGNLMQQEVITNISTL